MGDLKQDLLAVKDALDTAEDSLLPDPILGPMFAKADSAFRRISKVVRLADGAALEGTDQ